MKIFIYHASIQKKTYCILGVGEFRALPNNNKTISKVDC
jgi:hypothetical protein